MNRELVLLYWQIGHDILARQAEQGWGAKVIDRLSRNLRTASPDMKGFSRSNLIVIEIKAGRFKPGHLGQLSFCLNAVDGELKSAQDGPTIGLLLCKSKNEVVAEYAVRDITSPLGVSEYQLLECLPEPLQTSMPTIEEIERELQEGVE